MKTRKKGFKHYLCWDGDGEEIKKYCRSKEFDKHDLLMQCAVAAYPELSEQIYLSIIDKNQTYDRQNKNKYIPLSRGDFYGYQRKCLWIFMDMLRMGVNL